MKTLESSLILPLESNRPLPGLRQVQSGSATKKGGVLLSAEQVQCTLISLTSWESTTCGGSPQAPAALHKAKKSQEGLRFCFHHRDAP